MEEQPAGIGVTNGPAEPVRMMIGAKNTGCARTAMELWGSVRHTREWREENCNGKYR